MKPAVKKAPAVKQPAPMPKATEGESTRVPVEAESQNYYDNKKLNEAKQLFNKLMKNL
jgi:hypothetical protein